MAATTDQPGTFVLEIASTGKILVDTFTKFITYRKVKDSRLQDLYATLSVTTTTLTELGNTANQYENEFRINDDVTRPVCESIKLNFDKLLVMVKEGTQSGVWKNDGTLAGKPVTAEVDPWYLITKALGGRDEARDYWKSVDDTRHTLVALNDTVKYMILKDLSKKNILKPEQSEEFKMLQVLLPHLVKNHEMAQKRKKTSLPGPPPPPPPPPPGLKRRDTDASSQITLAERSGPRLAKDFDALSISSASSSDSEPDEKLETPDEMYEEWLLRWYEPLQDARKSWSLFGISVKESFDEKGFWGIDPNFVAQAEMKERHQYAAADKSESQHMEAMQKAIRAIPKHGGSQVDALLEERVNATTSAKAKRKWTVVAVQAKQKFPYSSKKNWGKNHHYTDWLVTIKGETVDREKRTKTYRCEDPWAKPIIISRSRSRSRGPNPFIRERSYSPIRIRNPCPPPAPRGLVKAFREPIHNVDFGPGTVHINEIPTQEEAEKKMDEIWAEMTGKVNIETASQ